MLPNQNVTNSSHEIIYEMYFPQKLKSVSKEREEKLQSTIFLSYKLYENLSPFMLQFCSSIRYFFQRTIRKSILSTLLYRKAAHLSGN